MNGSVVVLEYGLSSIILSLCTNIHKGIRRSFTKSGDLVMAASILSFIYGKYDDFLFSQSYLSPRFPDFDMDAAPVEAQKFGIECGRMMIQDTLSRHFGEDLPSSLLYFQLVYRVNGRFVIPRNPSPQRN